VQDYWKEGNLIMLNTLARQPEMLTPAFITNLLEIRAALAPVYTRLAFTRNREKSITILEALQQLPDEPAAYAQADQELHHQLTLLSGNQSLLIYNGFRQTTLSGGSTSLPIPSRANITAFTEVFWRPH
jgi:DNA-binding FadR family transcriptional regulator